MEDDKGKQSMRMEEGRSMKSAMIKILIQIQKNVDEKAENPPSKDTLRFFIKDHIWGRTKRFAMRIETRTLKIVLSHKNISSLA